MAINQLLYQMVWWMLKLRKGTREAWKDFRCRGIRQARQLTFLCLHERWSSVWLSRWWGYQGHAVRSFWHTMGSVSGAVVHFRPVEWWREQQQLSTGLRHKGRYHPKLHPLDVQMSRTANGDWRVIAQNRDLWKQRAAVWITQQDVPWGSGNQLAIED